MTVPTYDELMHPLLRVLERHPDGIRAGAAQDAVADLAALSEEDRAELLPSGRQAVYRNRVGWAHDRLKRAKLSMSPRRGVWRITDAGRAFLKSHPEGLDEGTRRDLASVETVSVQSERAEDATDSERIEQTTISPDERIEKAVQEIHDALIDDILELLARGSPRFFERVVLDVLHAMGYGTSRQDVHRVGRSHDGGIDGVISLDRLGIQKVYVQAKRWSRTVGRPDVQAFYGALAGNRARLGVMLSTSQFSKEAVEFANGVSDSVVLVGGDRLAALMIEHQVGVTHQPLKVGRLDTDYFEES